LVWLSKRELAYYLLLLNRFRSEPFNLGEALDLLTLLGSKRIAIKIIKRLTKRGFLKRENHYTYRVVEPSESLTNLLIEYIAQRLARYMKSSGVSVITSVDRTTRTILVEAPPELCKRIELLSGEIIHVHCREAKNSYS